MGTRSCPPKCRPRKLMGCLQMVLGALVILVTSASLVKYYNAGFFLQNDDICRYFYGVISDPNSQGTPAMASPSVNGDDGFDTRALSDRVGEVLDQMDRLQKKLERMVQEMDKQRDSLDKTNMTRLEFRRFLEWEVTRPLYRAHISLRQIRLPGSAGDEAATNLTTTAAREPPLINTFITEEIRKYISPKRNRDGKVNMYGTDRVYNTIGQGCVLVKKEFQEYMDYDIGSYCKDDWNLAQKLMVSGCDPLPRRRCLTRASKTFTRPYPINESLWKLPQDRNVRWGNYRCRNFKCLESNNTKRGYSKCTGCFEMEKEKTKWVTNTSLPVDFLIGDVLTVKPGEVRIGLDFSVSTGTFAARMRDDHNVTIVTTALNLGAPFNEMIALRGLIPLYVTLNQRLPFFDNTMDLIHTTGVMDGWLDLLLMDFVMYDWDRVLRPGGLVWIDRFYCNRKDLDDYMYMFLQFRYRKRKWVVSPKSKDEVFLSAVLEKPPRAI